MKPAFRLGLRGRLMSLFLIAFAGMFGMLAWHILQSREADISAAKERVWQSVKLIAAEQKIILRQADQVLLALMWLPQLREDQSPGECSRVLSAWLSEWDKPRARFSNAGLVNPNGDIACTAVPITPSITVADRDYFKKALRTHDLVISNAMSNPLTGGMAIDIAKGIWDDATQATGVLYVTLDLSWLNQELAKARLPAASSLVIADGHGTVLARYPDANGWVGRSVAELPLFRLVADTGEGSAEDSGPEGTRRIVAWTTLMDTIGGPVYLWIGIPKDVVIASARRETLSGGLISLALLVATFALLWIGGARWFLRPIFALSGAAQRISQGDAAARSGLEHADGELGQLVRSFDDMAEGIQSREKQLRRANRALHVLSAGNRALLRAQDEPSLLEDMCRAIGEAGDYRLVWVGYAEHDAQRSVRMAAAWGTETACLDGFKITWDETESGHEPPGTAIHRGIPVVSNDIAAAPDFGRWRESARRCGFASSVALPLRSDGAILGVLCICAAELGAFDENVVELLSEAADDLAFGIVTQRAEVKHGHTRQALQSTEARLIEAQRLSAVGSWEWDTRHDLVTWSEEMYKIYGRDPKLPPADIREVPSYYTPESWSRLGAAVETALDKGIPFACDVEVVRADGTHRWTTSRGESMRDGNGAVVGLRGTVQDITERKAAETALTRANRALRTLSAGNEALVRAASEEELLQAVTDVIVAYGGYRMAMVSFAEDNPEKSLRHMASAGTGGDFYAGQRLTWGDQGEGQVSIGRAIRSGSPVICHDIASDPQFAPWQDAALTQGYASEIGLPLSDGHRTFGGLSIYSSEKNAFDAEEARLLTELANDLAYGIVTLRTRAERDRISYAHAHHAEILQKSLEQSIQAIADTVEARDPYTAGHQRRVSVLAVAIAREMGLPEEKIHGIHLAAVIHDLGKIHVPAEILVNPGKLSDIEFMLIKTHPQDGYDILKDVDFPWPIADIVRQHHERMDGSGYPQGLKDRQILLESRIMAVADVVEAMASHRPYRVALGIEAALTEIERGRGSLYDAVVADTCLKLFREGRFAFQE